MFNMDVNQVQLIELGLNALGFFAGGGILMVLASIFRRKERTSVPVEPVANSIPQAIEKPKQEQSRENSHGFQFIDLSDGIKSKSNQNDKPSELTNSRRSRAEVYGLAQRMLESNKPTREISDELGMTQAEVNLLRARNNHLKGEHNV